MSFRRPGSHGHLRDGRPVGFASPAFAGFALIVRIADLDLSKKNGEPVNLQAHRKK